MASKHTYTPPACTIITLSVQHLPATSGYQGHGHHGDHGGHRGWDDDQGEDNVEQ